MIQRGHDSVPAHAPATLEVVEFPGWKGRVRTDTGALSRLDEQARYQFLRRVVESSSSLPGYAVLKYSAAGEVFAARIGDNESAPWVICKGYRTRSTPERLRSVLRGTRAERNDHIATVLEAGGFHTPRPLAILKRRGMTGDCWLITERIEGLVDLDTLAGGIWVGKSASALYATKRPVIEAVRDVVIRLKASGFHHRDFKASNVTMTMDDGSPTIWLVDLDGLSLFGGGRHPSQMWVRLAASLTEHRTMTRCDHLRLLQSIVGDGRSWKSTWRQWSQLVLAYNAHARKRKVGKLDGA